MELVKIGIGFFSIALCFCLFFMSLLWLLSRQIKNFAIVDIAWSALIAVCALFYLITIRGDEGRRILAASMACLWGFRLSLHVLYRNLILKEIDRRYDQLEKNWGKDHDKKMLGFYLIQGLVAALFSIPFLIVAFNTSEISILEWGGALLFGFALLGESLADKQLQNFKQNPANKGTTCRKGLWRYSRHPNYFFEWLIWCSLFLFSLGSPYGWASIYAPILIYHFLVNVTGIPKAEEQSMKSRGEDYKKYQLETSVFFPWFPKKVS